MKANVRWIGNLTFIGSSDSRRYTIIDHSEDKEKQMGSSPTELLLQALCSCTAMDIVNILQKMKEPLEGLEVRAEGFRSKDYPQLFTEINLEYVVKGNVSKDSLERAISLSQEKYCHISIALKRSGTNIKVSSKIEGK
ncbi:MAG: OsmC family protein [Thermoplasmatales archaeon]